MSDIMKERFSTSYESSAAASYLIISVSADEKLQGYQVEMIANNPNPNILPLDVRQKDNTINIYYNITSKLAMTQFLKRKKLKRNEFIDILAGIVKVLLDCRNYLLSDKSFLLYEDYIYINPTTLETSLVYMPLALGLDACQGLKNMIIRLIMFTADIDENGSDNFLQRILSLVKLDTFNISELDKLLRDLKNSSTPAVDIPGKQPEMVLPEPQAENNGRAQSLQAQASRVEKPAAKKEENPVKSPLMPKDAANPKMPPTPKVLQTNIPGPKVKEQSKAMEKEIREQYSSRTMLMLALSQIAILIAIIWVFSSGVLKSLDSDTTTSSAAVILILGAVDFLILRNLLDGKNKVIKQVGKNPDAVPSPHKVNVAKMEIRNIPDGEENTYKFLSKKEVKKVEVPVQSLPRVQSNDTATAVLSRGNGGDTVILENTDRKYPYLQSVKEGTVEDIPITKPSFIIGRLSDQVDYVSSNNAIGKIHAEIISRDGSYYIKDLNSRNGTFVNDVRINSNIEHEIKNNYKITLANSEYTLMIP